LQPTPSISLVHRLLRDKERIIFAFAVYGLVAGIFSVIDTNGYEPDILDNISIALNYPGFIAGMMIFGEHYSIPVPIPIWNAVIVLGTVTVWTVIGFIIYLFYRLFKLGP
jgi:hypothetical protein